MEVLVTGGCGYIGSHVTRQLTESGHTVTVVDNFSTGHREALIYGERVVELDLSNRDGLIQLMTENKFDAVIHFAASIIVPESVAEPIKYYRNNTVNALNTIEAAIAGKVKYFIFSSTAAVYGDSKTDIVTEESPVVPTNPYGTSKLMDEWILRDVAKATDLKYCVLRYFNVAGSDLEGRMGQRTKNATHLIKVANQCALGQRDSVTVFGTDYATKDGTGVRDYIHVEDLASAHLQSLDYLSQGGPSETFNCGYGSGFTVKEVLREVEAAADVCMNTIEGPRRAGDVGCLIADASKLRAKTGWTPKYNDLSLIVKTALAWEKKMLES